MFQRSSLSERDSLLKTIGNVLHPSVPVHNDEDFNEVVRTNGDCTGTLTSVAAYCLLWNCPPTFLVSVF